MEKQPITTLEFKDYGLVSICSCHISTNSSNAQGFFQLYRSCLLPKLLSHEKVVFFVDLRYLDFSSRRHTTRRGWQSYTY